VTAGTVDHYTIQLQQLLPPGAVITREQEATLTKLLRAIATELARVDTRGEELIVERDPSQADETLEDWEEALGLPDCANPTTLAARRAAVVAKLVGIEDQSAASYIALTAALGYTGGRVVTRPYAPFAAGSLTGEALTNMGIHHGDSLASLVPGPGWPYVWILDVIDQADGVDVTVGEADELDAVLECRVSRCSQGHSIPVHLYRLFASDDLGFTSDHDVNLYLFHPRTGEALDVVVPDTMPTVIVEGIEYVWAEDGGSYVVDNVLDSIPPQMSGRGWSCSVITAFGSDDTDDHTVFTIGDADGAKLELVPAGGDQMRFRFVAAHSGDGIDAANVCAVTEPLTFASSARIQIILDGQTGEMTATGEISGGASGDDGFLWDDLAPTGNLYVGKDA